MTAYAKSLDNFTSALDATEQFSLPYVNNIIGSRIKAIITSFPLVKAQVGDEAMSALAKVYAEYQRPQQWDINVYGGQFPGFLLAQLQGAKRDVYDWEYLAELAALEIAITQIYYTNTDTALEGNWPQVVRQQQAIKQAVATAHPYVRWGSFGDRISIRREGLKVAVGNVN